MNTILVGTDGSEAAERAVDVGARLAKGQGARLCILNVINDYGLSSAELDAFTHAEHASLSELLASLSAQLLSKAGDRAKAHQLADVSLESRSGDPAQAMIEFAQELKADAIVVGKRGRSTLAGLFLGSVSHKLVSLAPLYCHHRAVSSTRIRVAPKFRREISMRLKRAMTVRAAFVAIARASIDRVSTNVEGIRLEAGPEGIHQLRVAIRRLRAVFSAFRAVIPRRDRLRLGGELRWLQGEFGPAREWDVLIEETFGAIAKCAESREALHALVAVAEPRRGAAYAQSREALKDRRSQALLLNLAAWLEGPPWSAPREARDTPNPLDDPIGRFAARELRERRDEVSKLGTRIATLDKEALHDLRIRVKKLRYATEFFRELWPDVAAESYVEALKSFQHALGSVHDALVGAGLIDDLASEVGPEGEGAAALLRNWLNAQVEHDRKRLAGRWQELAELGPFWAIEE